MISNALISKKESILQGENVYFQKFVAKNGEKYGLRFGEPKDALEISNIFKEIYGYDYVNPIVYNIDLLKKNILKKNNLWFVGELLETKEIAGTGLIEKERYIAHASKAVTRKKYQGLGVTTKIGAAGIITVSKMPEFSNILRLNIEVRGPEIRAQKLVENAGALPYGLVPAYTNYGDKRNFYVDDKNPYPPNKEEAAILYSIIFRELWKRREKTIYLHDDDDYSFFYDRIRIRCKKMKGDDVFYVKGRKNWGHELYGVSKEYYEGILNLYGYIKEKSLNNLIKTYDNWRIILWRVPTTQNGLHSMALAIEKGFKVVGYDIGFSNVNWTLYDSVILAYYPNGSSQALEVNILDGNKPLLNKIKEQYSN